MQRALELADIAYGQGEVPIGAVVVYNGKIVGEGSNQMITSLDPSAHAEMVAVRAAAKTIGNYRLNGCTLYVTIEPCTMCAGMIVHSRIDRVVFGAIEPKAGAVQSAMKLFDAPHFNHVVQVEGGILENECSEIMSRFFQERREKKKALKKASKLSKDES